MMSKKGLIVLVVVAIALVLISVRLAMSDSDQVSVNTSRGVSADKEAGEVGVTIIAPEVEDKLSGGLYG
jgi:hypothetical protein